MTQASQVLPSWLTLSATTITEPDGSLSTSFATLRLPLTYYGPSIPLGTDGAWTYGGLSSPAPSTAEPISTPTPTQTPSIPPPETTLPPSLSPAPSQFPSSTPLSSLPSSPSSTFLSETPSSSLLSSISSSFLPSSSLPSTSLPSSVSESSSLLPTPSPSASSTVTPVAASHGIAVGTLAAILGTILGVILLFLIILVVLLIRRVQGRRRSDPTQQHTTSSFWNRQTMLFTRPGSRQTPLWTEWQWVRPEDVDTAPDPGQWTPGEGSPRGSGEEVDALLTRRSIHSGTVAEEMTQQKTGTDTLVSVPAAVAARPSPRTGHIIPREVLSRMVQEEEEAQRFAQGEIRVVQPSPPLEYSPLLPPPPLDPDGVRATRAAARHSVQSLTSHKSALSLEAQEGAELLTARRVRVSDLAPSRTASVQADPEAGTSTSRNTLGLQGLSGRLGRLSWFRRLSEVAGASGSSPSPASPRNSGRVDVNDPYTRTPPRTPRRRRSRSRSRSRSRPGSFTRIPGDDPDFPAQLAVPGGAQRPISSVSAKSVSAASGGTIYHDAVSTPPADVLEFPLPVANVRPGSGVETSSGNGSSHGTGGDASTGPRQSLLDRQQQLLLLSGVAHPQPPTHVGYVMVPPHDPPAYDDDSLPKLRKHSRLPSDVDVLDIPAPPPASPFASRPAFPPGLVQLPTPRTWRESYPSPVLSGSSPGSTGIAIDVLEEEPPSAREGWKSLATSAAPGTGEGRRTTFGTPMVVHPRGSPMNSEEGSLHSRPSHLSPYPSRSPLGSVHTKTGSNSSRPSAHSAGRSNSSGGHSLGHSSSVSSYGHLLPPRGVGEIGEIQHPPIASPPLSAVFPGRASSSGHGHTHTQASSQHTHHDDRRSSASSNSPFVLPPLPQHTSLFPLSESDISPASSSMPLLGNVSGGDAGGTVGSRDTTTNSSVTTALTDPITGSRMHFPGMPYRTGSERDRGWGEGDQHWSS